MATNFEIITKTPGTLGRFMSELDRELTMQGNACRFCGHYEKLNEPSCHAKCSDGFREWLEKEVRND